MYVIKKSIRKTHKIYYIRKPHKYTSTKKTEKLVTAWQSAGDSKELNMKQTNKITNEGI